MTANAIIILQKSDRIAELLEERVGVKGPTLDDRLRRARRALPRQARGAADRIAVARQMALTGGFRDVDAPAFDDDYRVLLRHLQALDPNATRRALLGGIMTGGMIALASGMLLGVGLSMLRLG